MGVASSTTRDAPRGSLAGAFASRQGGIGRAHRLPVRPTCSPSRLLPDMLPGSPGLAKTRCYQNMFNPARGDPLPTSHPASETPGAVNTNVTTRPRLKPTIRIGLEKFQWPDSAVVGDCSVPERLYLNADVVTVEPRRHVFGTQQPCNGKKRCVIGCRQPWCMYFIYTLGPIYKGGGVVLARRSLEPVPDSGRRSIYVLALGTAQNSFCVLPISKLDQGN